MTWFAEEPLEGQALELATQIAELKNKKETAVEEAKEGDAFLTETRQLLEEKRMNDVLARLVAESGTLLDASEKEFEPLYNLLVAFILHSESQGQHETLVKRALSILVADEREGRAILKLKVLQNLYNTLEATSPLRYDAFLAVLEIAAKNDEIEVVLSQLDLLETWVREWAIPPVKARELYLIVTDRLKEAGERKKSYEFLVRHLTTFNGASDVSTALKVAQRAVAEAIQLPDVLNFEVLLSLDAITHNLQGDKLFDLLKVFLSGNLKEYKAFVAENPTCVSKYGLNEDDNVRKIRLLTLASLAAEHLQREISYATIAQALEIIEEDVEMWVIDVIRANLIEAKINQVRRTVHVARSTCRTFPLEQWQQLADKLEGWRQSLSDILQVVANAKLIAQHSNVNAGGGAPVVMVEGSTVTQVNGQGGEGKGG